MRHARLFFLALLGSSATTAAAQQTTTIPTWSFTLGAGAFAGPKYPGADETWVLPIPLLSVEYKGRVFLGPAPGSLGAGLGVKILRGPVTWSVGLGGSDSRPSDRADALAGMEDHALGFAGVTALDVQMGPLSLSAAVNRGFNEGTGWGAGTHAGVMLPLSRRILVGVGGGASFADGKTMRYDFGITSAEASRRATLLANNDPRLEPGDDQVYRPDGGLVAVSGDASLTVLLSPRWALFGFGSLSRLSDEAARSPLVRDRSQWSGGGGFSFRP